MPLEKAVDGLVLEPFGVLRVVPVGVRSNGAPLARGNNLRLAAALENCLSLEDAGEPQMGFAVRQCREVRAEILNFFAVNRVELVPQQR